MIEAAAPAPGLPRPALFDRLAASAPHPGAAPLRPLALLLQPLLRDLGALFNATRPTEAWAGEDQVGRSVTHFGLPAQAARHVAAGEGEALAGLVREALQRFEPRLDPATLSLQVVPRPAPTGVALQIEADLRGVGVGGERLHLRAEFEGPTGAARLTALPAH